VTLDKKNGTKYYTLNYLKNEFKKKEDFDSDARDAVKNLEGKNLY